MSGDKFAALLFALWLTSGLIGAIVGRQTARQGIGCLLGLILGPIGWILVAMLDTRPCPMCGKRIKKAARVCPHCGRDTANA